jgi:hypothetical protein
MKKLTLLILAILFSASLNYSQVTTLWEKSAAAGTKPVWETGNNTRGLAYGLVGGNQRLYVPNRHADVGGKQIFIFNAATGDSIGMLDTTGILGGTLAVNDAEVSSDGKIFVCNLVVGGFFKVYRYDREASAPVVVINYETTLRLGDKITVTGSTADNSIIIWVVASLASPGAGSLIKFTTTDNGASFTPTIIPIATTASSASAGPLPDASFYINAHGTTPAKYNADGTAIGTIPTAVISTSGSAIRHLVTSGGDEYLAANELLTTTNNAKIIKVVGGDPTAATSFATTPVLGAASAGGLGDVSIRKISDLIYNVYVLATNNGFGAYKVDLRNNLAGDYYIPQGANPQGFATLNDAVTSLNTNGALGTVNFLLDADELRENSFTFTELLSADNNVVIKPAPGRTCTLFVTSSPTVGNGPFMIGFNSGYVTFDGSNNGTDSRNLIVTTEQTAPVVDLPFTLNNANADNVVLKNLIIKNIVEGQTNFRYGAVINDLGGVTGFRVENCQIGTAERPVRRDGLAPWGGGAVANQFSIVNNEIYCGTRGVATIYLTNSEIIGNTINLLPTTAAATDAFNHGIYITGHTGTLLIHENTINCLEKTIHASAYLIGIAFAGNGSGETDIISIVNNMVNVGAANETRYTYGIGLRSALTMGNLKIYHNTIVINNNSSALTSHAIGNHTNGTGPVNIDLKNNIIINNHSGNTASSAIGVIPATSVLTSDYNLLLSNQNFVNYQGTTYADLAAWQATLQDANSVSKVVNFVSGTDLHLAGASVGDFDLAGTPIAEITTDIDGDTRSATYPYMGADEGDVPLALQEPLVLEENFDYGASDNSDLLAVTTNWTRHSGAAGPSYTAAGLTYPGYPSSNIGGAVNFTNGGSGVNDGDVHRTSDSLATTGNLYVSCLVKINSALATADYFFHLGPKTLGTTFRGRVYAKTNGAGFSVSLSKTGNPIVDNATVLNFGQTYLFVLKYSLNTTATDDDIVTLYVYDTGVPGAEPGTPVVTIGPVGAGVADGLTNIGAIAIRQGTNTPTGIIDGIRVFTSWDAIPVELTSFIANVDGNSVKLNWSTATETNNSGFEIERKSTTSSWSKVGFVPGFGTTTEVKKYSFADNNLAAGTYSYRLKQIDFDGTFEYSNIVEVEVNAPTVFDLAQNYPNPFNPSTTISYTIPKDVKVRLDIFTILGEHVAALVDEFQTAGKYSVVFDAGRYPSGTYIYRLTAENNVITKKMMLVK